MKRAFRFLCLMVLIFTVLSLVPVAAQDPYWTEVDALVALRMAVGLQDSDPAMDVDGDGGVTEADALLILVWAVSGTLKASTTPSGSQVLVKNEDEAVRIADAIVAAELPEMAAAEKAVQGYETTRGSFYDVTYRSTLQVEADGEALSLPRIVIVSVDRATGETAVAVSD